MKTITDSLGNIAKIVLDDQIVEAILRDYSDSVTMHVYSTEIPCQCGHDRNTHSQDGIICWQPKCIEGACGGYDPIAVEEKE